jgi:hypothetical protein
MRFVSLSSAIFKAKASLLTAAAVNLTGASIFSKSGTFLGLTP